MNCSRAIRRLPKSIGRLDGNLRGRIRLLLVTLNELRVLERSSIPLPRSRRVQIVWTSSRRRHSRRSLLLPVLRGKRTHPSGVAILVPLRVAKAGAFQVLGSALPRRGPFFLLILCQPLDALF